MTIVAGSTTIQSPRATGISENKQSMTCQRLKNTENHEGLMSALIAHKYNNSKTHGNTSVTDLHAGTTKDPLASDRGQGGNDSSSLRRRGRVTQQIEQIKIKNGENMNTITGEPRYKSEFRLNAYQGANRKDGSQMPIASDV